MTFTALRNEGGARLKAFHTPEAFFGHAQRGSRAITVGFHERNGIFAVKVSSGSRTRTEAACIALKRILDQNISSPADPSGFNRNVPELGSPGDLDNGFSAPVVIFPKLRVPSRFCLRSADRRQADGEDPEIPPSLAYDLLHKFNVSNKIHLVISFFD